MLKRIAIVAASVIVVVIAVPAILILALSPEPLLPPEAADNLSQVDQYFQKLVEPGYPPGISVVVRKDGRVVFNEAYGTADFTVSAPMTPQTSVRWWSVTKLVTAAAVLQLVDRGRLSLEDRLHDYLPYVAFVGDDGEPRNVTVLQLLNHSSGVQDNIPEGLLELRFPDEPPIDQVAYARDLIATKSLLTHEPGSYSSYTNTSYILLGALVQAASGERFETYVRREILIPLGMIATDFVFVKQPVARGSHPVFHFITPFLFLAGSEAQRAMYAIEDNLIWFSEFYLKYTASTSLNGPVVEMSRFNQMVLNGGVLEGARILSATSADMFVRDHQIPVESGIGANPATAGVLFHGISWQRVSDSRYRLFHSGGGPGFAAFNAIYPDENLSYSFVANGTGLPRDEIRQMLDRIDWSALIQDDAGQAPE